MSESPAKRKELRFIFVQMLFALAVAEIARRTVLLIDGTNAVDIWPGMAHLLLALIVVATSWVGWANSPTNEKWTLSRTWSREFLVLLVDVLLVILYFVLVSKAEKPEQGGRISPSARGETLVLVFVFLVYVVWDALTKLGRLSFRAYFNRGWITWVCAMLTLLVWVCHAHVTHRGGVIITDLILILVVLAFRAFKDKPTEQPISILGFVLLGATGGLFIVTLCFPSIMRGQG